MTKKQTKESFLNNLLINYCNNELSRNFEKIEDIFDFCSQKFKEFKEKVNNYLQDIEEFTFEEKDRIKFYLRNDHSFCGEGGDIYSISESILGFFKENGEIHQHNLEDFFWKELKEYKKLYS